MSIEIIVVGASAGGIEALRVLIGALPADLSASPLHRGLLRRPGSVRLKQHADIFIEQ